MKTSVLLLLGLLCLAAAKPHNEGKRNHQPKRTREHKLTNRMDHDHHRREHGVPHKAEIHRAKKVNSRRPPTSPASPAAPPQGQQEVNKDLHLQHITEHNIEKKHEDKQRSREVSAAAGAPPGKTHLLTNRAPSVDNLHLLNNRSPQALSSSSSSSSPSPPPPSPPLPSNTPESPKNNNNKTKVDGIPMESERLIHVTARPPKAHKAKAPPHRPAAVLSAHSTPQNQPGGQQGKGKAHKAPKKYNGKKHGWKKNMRKEKAKDKVKKERRDKKNKPNNHRAMPGRKL